MEDGWRAVVQPRGLPRAWRHGNAGAKCVFGIAKEGLIRRFHRFAQILMTPNL